MGSFGVSHIAYSRTLYLHKQRTGRGASSVRVGSVVYSGGDEPLAQDLIVVS